MINFRLKWDERYINLPMPGYIFFWTKFLNLSIVHLKLPLSSESINPRCCRMCSVHCVSEGNNPHGVVSFGIKAKACM